MATREPRPASSQSPPCVPFDPYAPPKADLVRAPRLTVPSDWVYPLTLRSGSGLLKLSVVLRDAIEREVLLGALRWHPWELFTFRLRRDPSLALPWIEVKPRRPYRPTDLVMLDDGEEVASLRLGLVVTTWTARTPGGICVQIRPTSPLTRWGGRNRREPDWPKVARVGQQLPALAPQGRPTLTVHAGPGRAPFLVVRRSFEGLLPSTRVERLEGQVEPEAEWLGLQLVTAAFLQRLPGIG